MKSFYQYRPLIRNLIFCVGLFISNLVSGMVFANDSPGILIPRSAVSAPIHSPRCIDCNRGHTRRLAGNDSAKKRTLTTSEIRPDLSNLLSRDISLSDQIAVYEKKQGKASSLLSMQLHFLTANDCYAGYAGRYDTLKNTPAFPIFENRVFGLNATAVYQSAIIAVGAAKLDQINSVLVRFISNTDTFARFTGSCNDQKINCCIPIDCSHATGSCLAKNDMGAQTIIID